MNDIDLIDQLDEDEITDEPTLAELVQRLRDTAEEYNDEVEENQSLIELLEEAADLLEAIDTKVRARWLDYVPDADEVRLSEIQQVFRTWGWELSIKVVPAG